jgi:hypothetical protein
MAGLSLLTISCLLPHLSADDAQQALARAANSPYEIERFVATHNQYDWAPLWQALEIHDVSLPACTQGSESLAACSADVISVFDPSQVLVILRHAAYAAEVYLRFMPSMGADRTVKWRFAGHYQPRAAYFRPRYRLILFDRKPFLILTGHGASARDASGQVEQWLDLTAPELAPAFYYTSKASQENKSGIRREVTAVIASAQQAPVETIRVVREVTFFAEDFEGEITLGSQRAASIYTRPGGGQFIFDETQSSLPESDVVELYEGFEETLSNEDFLRLDLAALTSIAHGAETREKRWLRLFLDRCADTEEKRALAKLLM